MQPWTYYRGTAWYFHALDDCEFWPPTYDYNYGGFRLMLVKVTLESLYRVKSYEVKPLCIAGGCWLDSPWYCWPAYHYRLHHFNSGYDAGFRLMLIEVQTNG